MFFEHAIWLSLGSAEAILRLSTPKVNRSNDCLKSIVLSLNFVSGLREHLLIVGTTEGFLSTLLFISDETINPRHAHAWVQSRL